MDWSCPALSHGRQAGAPVQEGEQVLHIQDEGAEGARLVVTRRFSVK